MLSNMICTEHLGVTALPSRRCVLVALLLIAVTAAGITVAIDAKEPRYRRPLVPAILDLTSSRS